MEILKRDIGYLLNKIALKFKNSLNRLLKGHGYMTTADQFEILVILNERPALTQSEIAEITSKNKTNITRMLDAMERHELIRRMRHESDRRAYRIVVIAKGQEETIKVRQLIDRLRQQFVDLLGQRDLEELTRILNNIDERLP